MLTIRIINGCDEALHESTHVEYAGARERVPASGDQPETPPFQAKVVAMGCPGVDGGVRIITDGTVYVMNDKGRTIATYHPGLQNEAAKEAAARPNK